MSKDEWARDTIGVAVWVIVGLMFALVAMFFAPFVLNKPKPTHLTLAKLEYTEIDGVGYMTQHVVPAANAVTADWFATVTRVTMGISTVLCKGGGRGIYDGTPDTYSLDEWTGDDCPDVLQPGDRPEVSWTYINQFGERETLSRTLIIE